MTTKDLIASMSTIGDILKMMPDVKSIDDETIQLALSTKRPDQRIGERFVELGLITSEQLHAALSLQERIRNAKSIEEVADFLDSVRSEESRVRAAVTFALPPTGTGA